MTRHKPITDVVDTLQQATADDELDLQGVVEEFGRAAFASALLALGLILLSPLSGIPLVTSACGLGLLIVGLQAALGRRRLWLPGALRQKALASDRANRAIARMRRVARWLETRAEVRFSQVVSPAATRAIYGLYAFVGLLVPLLEMVPLSGSVVGLSVTIVAVGVLMRDGLLAVMGLCVLPLATIIPVTAIVAITD